MNEVLDQPNSVLYRKSWSYEKPILNLPIVKTMLISRIPQDRQEGRASLMWITILEQTLLFWRAMKELYCRFTRYSFYLSISNQVLQVESSITNADNTTTTQSMTSASERSHKVEPSEQPLSVSLIEPLGKKIISRRFLSSSNRTSKSKTLS